MATRVHQGDLPDLSLYGREVAIDTETMGLITSRDRLCVVQLSPGDGSADIVQIGKEQTRAPNLEKLLSDPNRTKIFHFARFDVAALRNRFGVEVSPVYCTKIASKLVRTYTDRHGLKDLARELLGVDLPSSSRVRTGARKSSSTRSSTMPRPMSFTCTISSVISIACLNAKGGRNWRASVSSSCRRAQSSIWPAGPRPIYSPIPDARPDPGQPLPTAPGCTNGSGAATVWSACCVFWCHWAAPCCSAI